MIVPKKTWLPKRETRVKHDKDGTKKADNSSPSKGKSASEVKDKLLKQIDTCRKLVKNSGNIKRTIKEGILAALEEMAELSVNLTNVVKEEVAK